LELPRISSRELAGAVDIPRILEQRHRLLLGSLTRLAANRSRSVFYHLDLEKAARDFREASLPLPPEPAVEEDFLTRINDHMFRARCASEEKESRRYEDRAFSLLREEMIKTLAAEPLEPARCLLDDQILWGRSPVRLDLAGGWTDTPPYCIMAGGTVVNLAVELNGQLPLQVYARPLAKPKIVLRSIDQGQTLEINSFEELQRYRQLGGTFSIPMAALVLAGFGPTFSRGHFRDLEEQLNEFGGGVEMSLLAAVPKGSGLGTSSNLAATVLGTLSEFCGLSWDRHQVAYRTLILEQMLTTGGGWQDQYGGIFEGVKLLETEAGIRQEPAIKWLPGQLFDRPEDRTRMLLYYTGVTRVARDILGEIVKSMFLNSAKHLAIFSEMKQHARDTFEVLLRNDYQGLSERVRHSWELNQRLDPGTNPPSIRAITRKIDDYALGYKLLGAGGGGYLLILAKSAEAAVRIKQTLVEEPPNAMARFVDFRVSSSRDPDPIELQTPQRLYLQRGAAGRPVETDRRRLLAHVMDPEKQFDEGVAESGRACVHGEYAPGNGEATVGDHTRQCDTVQGDQYPVTGVEPGGGEVRLAHGGLDVAKPVGPGHPMRRHVFDVGRVEDVGERRVVAIDNCRHVGREEVTRPELGPARRAINIAIFDNMVLDEAERVLRGDADHFCAVVEPGVPKTAAPVLGRFCILVPAWC
jgi:galactokinase/mevalonate kinase-like predicted kinase